MNNDDLSEFHHVNDGQDSTSIYNEFPNVGRVSSFINEDEYDYAIELKPDDEYRQVSKLAHIYYMHLSYVIPYIIPCIRLSQAAEALPEITDFNNLERVIRTGKYEYENRNKTAFGSMKEYMLSPEHQSKNNTNAVTSTTSNKQDGLMHVMKSLFRNDHDADDHIPDVLQSTSPPSRVNTLTKAISKKDTTLLVPTSCSSTTNSKSVGGSNGTSWFGTIQSYFSGNEGNKVNSINVVDRSIAADALHRSCRDIMIHGYSNYDDEAVHVDDDSNEHNAGTTQSSHQCIDIIDEGIDRASKVNSKQITMKEYVMKMNELSKYKRWQEKAARRSSVNFRMQYELSDKKAMDRFLILLFNGVNVRRHQDGYTSELVRLYSQNGCKNIHWESTKTKKVRCTYNVLYV